LCMPTYPTAPLLTTPSSLSFLCFINIQTLKCRVLVKNAYF
jgi:hypothetical protein